MQCTFKFNDITSEHVKILSVTCVEENTSPVDKVEKPSRGADLSDF